MQVTKIADKEIAACWCETGRVHIFDLSPSLKSLEVTGQRQSTKSNPLHTFARHQIEGYAIDWSSLVTGKFETNISYK